MEFKKIDYPISYAVADSAAKGRQKRYIFWKNTEYASILVAAITAIPAINNNAQYNYPALFSGISFLIAIIVIFVEKVLGYRDGWFKCRAFAEAVKAESWKFRSGTCDYDIITLDEKNAMQRFIEFLSRLRESLDISQYTAGLNRYGDEVSDEMLSSRKLPFSERVVLYNKNRIVDQIGWYTKEGSFANSKLNIIFIAIIVALLFGLIFSVVNFFHHLRNLSFIGLFSSLAALLSGWAQIRMYETNRVAYTKTADELRGISQLAVNVQTELEFNKIVEAAESVISKEHTIWVRRSGII